MWIRQLEVQHFKGIQSASLRFGPGLNVLHGRNELGKSSLVHAIRAALLLPDSSSARSDFVDWHTDQPPQVTLVFETEPQRIWKVRKSFGSGSDGWSYLEFSKDGVTFGQEAKGREVDGQLRKLLRWGIEGPGGRGGPKGLPGSFLATALLADQKDVEAVLHRGLHDDSDESGKQRLTEALQALAEDPVFRRIFEATQERVDEAFTSTGQRRRGRGSPWVELRDQKKLVETRKQDVNVEVEKSRGAEQRVTEVRERLDAAAEQLHEARESLQAAEADWARQQARQQIETTVQQARQQRDRITKLHEQVAQTEAEVKSRRSELAEAEQRRVAAEKRRGELGKALETARERLRDLESGTAEQTRKLRQEQLAKSLLECEAREKEARALAEKAGKVGELEQKARAAREDLRRRQEAAKAADGQIEEVTQQLEDIARTLGQVEEQRHVLHLLAARKQLSAREQKAKAVDEQQALVQQCRAEANEIRKAVAKAGLPDAAARRELAELAQALEVAEAALEVGLSVTVRPVKSIDVAVTVDGEEPALEGAEGAADGQELVAGSELSWEARRKIELRLKDVADVEVSGGSAEQQAKAKKLREQWEGRAKKVFAQAKVESLEQLEEQAKAAQAKEQEAQALEARGKQVEAGVEGAGDVGAALSAAKAETDQAESQLEAVLREGDRLEDVVGRWDKTDDADEGKLAVTLQQTRAKVDQLERQAAELKQKAAAEKAVIEARQPELATLEKEASAAAAALDGDGNAVQERAIEAAESAAQARSDKQAELEQLQGQGTAEHSEARDAVQAAEADLAKATTDLTTAQESEKTSRSGVDGLEAILHERRAAAAREDLPAAEAALHQRLADLEAHPVPPTSLTEDQLNESRAAVAKRETDHQHLQAEYQKAQGALQQVGGQYVQERLRQVEESLQALTDREHETELDYKAWQLLLETLRDSEREDAVHLGQALVEPITRRMSELTQGRYQGLGIGPKLETRNIQAAGEPRDLASLSVGTREQLATVLRLTIAQALKSVLVLDDQLVQSDPERMHCLAAFMAECAREFQILVFTCRPEEYRGVEGGEAEWLELEGVVKRS